MNAPAMFPKDQTGDWHRQPQPMPTNLLPLLHQTNKQTSSFLSFFSCTFSFSHCFVLLIFFCFPGFLNLIVFLLHYVLFVAVWEVEQTDLLHLLPFLHQIQLLTLLLMNLFLSPRLLVYSYIRILVAHQ